VIILYFKDGVVSFIGIYTASKMKNYRSLEAHTFFTDGWVQTVHHFKPERSESTIFKTQVKPSYRVTEKPHNTWVAVMGISWDGMGSDGNILAAHCDCIAG